MNKNINKEAFLELIENTKKINSSDLISYYNLENESDNFKDIYNRGVEDSKEKFLTFLTVFNLKSKLK